mmetsp:Transcript_18147/g.32377  ORF Transcript_18147/g.32377 Transcript_18147/m.32377 type:complete len:757 (+) Transcript_18147:71-2341(+)
MFSLPKVDDASLRLPELTSPTHQHDTSDSPGSRWSHPKSFECPISQLCMHDPVLLCDGHSYERHNIMKWIEQHNKSPVTGAELLNKTLYPNHALRNAIEEYFQQVNNVYRRAIRKTFAFGSPSGPASNVALERTVNAFMQCSLLVHADLSTERVLHQIMDEAKALVGAEVASVFLLDSMQKELYSTVNSTKREIRISATQGIAGHVATTGTATIIPDAYSDERFNKSVDVKTGLKTRDIMCVPLKTKKEGVIGVVQLINKTQNGVLNAGLPGQDMFEGGLLLKEEEPLFTENDLQFLKVFASQATMAIANSGMLDEPMVPTPKSPESSNHTNVASLAECVLSCVMRPSKEEEGDNLLKEIEDSTQAQSCADGDLHLEIEAETDIATPISRANSNNIKVAKLLSSAYRLWQVDTLELARLTNDKPLSTLGCYLFDRLGLIDDLGLDRTKLTHFMVAIEDGYPKEAPYHNTAHAASCVQIMHALLDHGGLVQVGKGTIFQNGDSNGNLRRMSCLLACAVHDFEHLAVTNDFLIKTGDKRAMMYNDKSVNENHHIASSFCVLRRAECNFLSDFMSTDPTSYSQFRALAIDLVLATDMAVNGKIVQAFKSSQDPAADEKTKNKQGSLLLQMGIKCADLGHLTLEWDTHSQWVQLLEEEFFAQGDLEKELGLQQSFLMDRSKPGPSKTQIGFFNFVVFPLFGSLHVAAPATAPMMDALNDNFSRYKQEEIVRKLGELARKALNKEKQDIRMSVTTKMIIAV